MSSTELTNFLKSMNKGLLILSRLNNKSLWNSKLKEISFIPHFYSNDFLDYQNEYFQKNCEELSFMAFKNDSFLFQLSLFKVKSKREWMTTFTKIVDLSISCCCHALFFQFSNEICF